MQAIFNMAKINLPPGIKINRRLKGVKTRPFSNTYDWRPRSSKMQVRGRVANFTDVFAGFETVPSVKRAFGKRTARILAKLKVGVYDGTGYAWVDEGRNRIMINKKYLERGRQIYLYLDIVHELMHFRQHMEGADLWDEKYQYVDRPTEIEAYRASVAEAKRLGMSKKEIASYLYMSWLTNEQFKRLLKNAKAN
jgi:predicted SprT family Zn-dependent metalloprotease